MFQIRDYLICLHCTLLFNLIIKLLVIFAILQDKENCPSLLVLLLLLLILNYYTLIFGGPLATPSVHNHRYFLTVLDDHSRYVWIILLKHKSKVSLHVQNCVTLIETQFHTTPKTIRTDNGPEFLLPSFYAAKGIIHH
jgi:hypothetical protein